jgi:integrase
MLVTHNNPAIPHSLRGLALIEPTGLPRFWSAVWASFLPGDGAHSTLKKKLRAVEHFYRFADNLLGAGGLDVALAAFDLEAIGETLEAYLLALRHDPRLGASTEKSWQCVLRFLQEVLDRMARSASSLPSQDDLQGRLASFERFHGTLHVSRRRRPARVRSLPAAVVEALYEVLDPDSPKNPFREGTSRWRVYVIFMLLLHQGLRRGELLCLPADAVRNGFNESAQRDRF